MDWTSLFSFRPWTWLMAESHFLYFWLSWTTGLVGLWTPGGSLRCWALSTVDRKNGPLHNLTSNFKVRRRHS